MNLDDVLATCMKSQKGGVKITTLPGASAGSEAKTLEELRKLRLLSIEDGEPYKLVFKGHLIWLTKSQWGWYVNARPESVIPAATRTPKTVKSTPVTTTSSHGGGLSTEQQSVVDHIATSTRGDVLVIAGPGSGKTKTLVSCIERIVKEGTPGEKIAAISFTNNSAAELKVRLCKVADDLSGLHRVHVSTFHGWVSQLASLHVEPWLHPPIGLQTASLAVALHLRNPDTTHVFTLTEINAAERHFEGCESFEAMEARNFNKIGQKGSSHESRLGFDNLVKAAGKLQEEMHGCQISTFGSLMKSGIDLAKGLQSGDLQWLFIDEAQDLNSTQADFVRAVQERTGCRVFAIADDDQGIYKFRGASNQFLREFGGNKTTTTFTLSENFRSTQPIVEASLGWIRPNWEKTARPAKTLHSTRDGLPIVLLTAYRSEDRQRHARVILEACKKNGLIDAMGEVAALSLSANPHTCYDLHEFGLDLKSCTEEGLPQEVLEDFLNHCEGSAATGDWHHQLWGEFLDRLKTAQEKEGETRFGYPGLRDLYASLEVLRRFNPEIGPKVAAGVLRSFNSKEKLSFLGSKPDPDYSGEAINFLSLHSSKGMEFRVVWLIGGDFVIKEKTRELEQGQPNVLGELGAWSEASTSTEEANRLAAEMENRRLLYVGMSRATDLLMISVPPKREKSGPDFRGQIQAALKDVPSVNVYSDNDAEAFARKISKVHRNDAWIPPRRYRVESFTSLTRQVTPGEEREQEIPCDREFPQPQLREAMIGDLFHRIMHLLRLEPELIDKRRDGSLSDDELIARVSMRTNLGELRELLGNYFSDSVNRPWQWIQKKGTLTEFPFSHVELDGHEEILIKGFIDLAGFAPDGAPDLLVDYKTGTPPIAGSEEDQKHGDQLKLYAKSLSSSYSCTPETITLLNYYVQSQEIRQRS